MSVKFNTMQELFEDEDRWTVCAMSENNNGQHVDVFSDEAVCWCFLGGLYKVYFRKVDPESWCKLVDRVKLYIKQHYNYNTVPSFNDSVAFETIQHACKELNI